MSKEKQIKEMAKELCGYSKPNGNCEFDDKPCNPECIYGRCAEIIYTAGYRKQSEVVRCKDCEHFYQDGNVKVCRHWNCHSTEDDAYCSYAKMKRGADNERREAD